MVWPGTRALLSSLERSWECFCCWANMRAATSRAGASIKFSASLSWSSSDSTSRRSSKSAAHALSRNAPRSDSSCSSAEWYNCSRRRARSASIVLCSARFSGRFYGRFCGHGAQQPSFGKSPVALDGLRGYLKSLRGFLNFKSAKKTQFHHLTLPGIEHGKFRQGLIERQDIPILLWSDDQALVQRNLHRTSTSLLIIPGTRKIRQDAAHHPGGNGEKMSAILPIHRVDIHQAEVNLVDQGGGLQSVTRIFPSHAAVRQSVQLVFDHRSQLRQRPVVPGAPRFK